MSDFSNKLKDKKYFTIALTLEMYLPQMPEFVVDTISYI